MECIVVTVSGLYGRTPERVGVTDLVPTPREPGTDSGTTVVPAKSVAISGSIHFDSPPAPVASAR